jgi:APA family basic amino acid/polyamine antiporter
MTTGNPSARPLRRILGLGFGLAIGFGGTVGVGILRLPGTLAATLGDARLIILFWVLGGAYALLGALTVAELSAMSPQAGGFYVYARRAFGDGAGVVLGWSDWLNNVASVAYAAITATTFLAALWPAANAHPQLTAVTIVAAFTAYHWIGLKSSSSLTGLISVSVGVMLMVLVAACFLSHPADVRAAAPLGGAGFAPPLILTAGLGAVVAALRAVLVTYDGWYSPIYFAEENTDPSGTMPRALIGGTLIVAALYIVINVALLRVLPMATLAGSQLPAADAARLVFPEGGATLVTIISIVTVLSLINAAILLPPRILLAMSRDGLFAKQAMQVSAGGTPRVALAITSGTVILLIMTGSFEQIVALAAVLFVLNYLSAYTAMFVLRRREPDAPRPFRTPLMPVTTGIVLVGSVLFLAAAIRDDIRSSVIAGVFVVAVGGIYWLIRRGTSP